MRMRMHATPGDPKDKQLTVPPDQRLHVHVGVGSSGSDDRLLWFRKVPLSTPTPQLHASLLVPSEYWDRQSIGPSGEAFQDDIHRSVCTSLR